MSVIERVLAEIRDEEIVELTRALVRIPSVVRPGDPEANEGKVAAFLESWFRREGLQVEVQAVAPGRPNVLAWLGEKADGRCLLLEGHTDVVTEGDPAEWTYPPFAAELVDGRIYGRGAADMKGGLAAAMVTVAAIRRAGVSPCGKLVVGALVDEEGEMLGARHLCRTPLAQELDAAIICEPEGNEICLEQRGVVWARLRARGRMAHGAMPEAGINPIRALAAVLTRVPALERRLRRCARRSRYLGRPTVTPTVVQAPIKGSPQPNVIPSGAEVILDIRITPGIDESGIRKELDALCAAAEGALPGARVEWEPVAPLRLPTKVDKGEPLARALHRAVSAVTGSPPRYGGVPGSTDGTILRMELGLPIATCGPGDRLIPHQIDEYVDVKQLLGAARTYALASLNFLDG